MIGPAATARAAEPQKRVLALFSTRQGAPFAVVAQRNLPLMLRDGMKQGVDFQSEFIETPLFSRPEFPNAYRDFLRLKYQAPPVDLVIAVGTLAIEFLAINRAVLFPSTPVVFYDIEPPRVRMPNSTGLVNELHFTRTLDVAVALQPDVKHVYVVSGTADTDRENEEKARAEFLPLAARLDFNYLSGLVTRDLEARLRALPPDSAVFVVLVTKDGSGEEVQQMDYLSWIASVANAPTYSWVNAAADVGIAGCSRRDQVAEAKAIAALAVRLLNGARADDIPVSRPAMDVVQLDWRQLRRWGIKEARVPVGATVLFREPSAWERYKRYIAGALALMLAQMALIGGLLVQRSKRKRAELSLRESQAGLRASYDRIRRLGRHLIRAQETERAHLAREVHDDINQQLAILSMDLDSLRLDRRRLHLNKRLAAALEKANTISTSLHDLSHRLHPAKLELLGLVAAIGSLQRDFSQPLLSINFAHQNVPAVIEHEVGCACSARTGGIEQRRQAQRRKPHMDRIDRRAGGLELRRYRRWRDSTSVVRWGTGPASRA